MKHESNLHAALAEMGITAFTFQNGGTSYPVDLTELPAETLARIMDYGKRIFNDAVNNAVHQGKDREQAAAEWLTKAKTGNLGARTGGTRATDPLAKATREVVEEYLRAAGWKAADAKKEGKDPQEAFKALLALQIARGRGVPLANVPSEDVSAAFAKNWPKVEAKAQERVAQQKDDGLDLGGII